MLKYIFELLGTFILLFVILNKGQPIPIAIALATGIYISSNISGGHLNPVVSTVMLLKQNIDFTNYVGYILSQLAGGLIAFHLHSLVVKE